MPSITPSPTPPNEGLRGPQRGEPSCSVQRIAVVEETSRRPQSPLRATWRPAWVGGAPITGRPRPSVGSRSSSSPSASAEWPVRRRSIPTPRVPASPAAWTGSSRRASSGRPTRASSSRVARCRRPILHSQLRSRTSLPGSPSSTSSRTFARPSIRPTPARSRRTAEQRWSSSRSAAKPTRPQTRSPRSSPRSTMRSGPTRSCSSASSGTRARSTRSRRHSRTTSGRPVSCPSRSP